MCVWGALRQPQSLGLAKEVGRGHSVGQRSPQLDLSAWPSKHQAEFMQKDAVSELQWGGGRWQQRRPGAASRGAAMLAAGKAQSVSCLMFSMETGSSGLEALSGVDMSTCSSFTRTAMTKEGEAGGPRGQRERTQPWDGRAQDLASYRWGPQEEAGRAPSPPGGSVTRRPGALSHVARQAVSGSRALRPCCPPGRMRRGRRRGQNAAAGSGQSGVDVWEAPQAGGMRKTAWCPEHPLQT